MRLRGFIVCLMLFLAGCQQVELYSSLSEQEGNEIIAVLLTNGVMAEKTRAKEFVTIRIPSQDVAYAMDVLRHHGLPREHFTDLGQIFQKQGLIASPMEERVRYTYGLSQMLAETLTQIDGVLSARVLIVLPEDAGFGQKPLPSSASVFVKYLPALGVEESVPRIKTLVQNSVDGLNYDKISVALFPQRDSLQTPFSGNRSEGVKAYSLWPWIASVLALLVILLSGASLYLWRRMKA